MLRILVFALSLTSLLDGQSLTFRPNYTSKSITSAAAVRENRVATNTLLSIYGEYLSNFSWAIHEQDLHATKLPTSTPNGEVTVQVQGLPLPLYFVSPSQINVLLPIDFDPGTVNLRVYRDLIGGPTVPITIHAESPELFRDPAAYAAATHQNGSVITADAPATPGEIVVLYGTGFGALKVKERNKIVPTIASEVLRRAEYRVRIDGREIDPKAIYYIGVTPGFAGLYQVNLRLPDQLGSDPIIEVGIGDNWSDPGTRLKVEGN